MTDETLELEEIKKSLTEKTFYRSVTVLGETDSTNTRLKALAAEGAPEGTVVIAGTQTAGRGRLGRSFWSPEGSGLYLSILLRPGMAADAQLVTPAAAVAVRRALGRTAAAFGLPSPCPRVKWVNDVLVGGRKVCGILTESATDSDGRLAFAVLGIGINVYPPDGGFPEEINSRAGAVFGKRVPGLRPYLAAALLDAAAEVVVRGGADFVGEYRRLCSTVGPVTVTRGDEVRCAEALRVDDHCRLVVRYPDGTEEALSSGEVSVRTR